MNFVGVDLAWTTSGGTGLCLIRDGRAVDSARVSTDAEILGWLAPKVENGAVVAIDAPLIVRNRTGRRACDQLISRCFGAQHASTHSANLGLAAFRDGVRAARIADALDLDTDPEFAPGSWVRRAIEVYPHPAIVALFDLRTTLKYKGKPGRALESRSSELAVLISHLETLANADPPLEVCTAPRWDTLAKTVFDPPSGAELSRAEDEIDAFVCAYTALYYWSHGTERCRVAGDTSSGYIVTPVSATHAACLDRLTVEAASAPAPRATAAPGSAAVANATRVRDLVPEAVVASSSPHVCELHVGGPAGLVFLVTAESIELRLPTVEWSGGTHDPVTASRFWKRINASAADAALAAEIETALTAREAEHAICRYCDRRVPREHRIDSDVCHDCASTHEGVVF